MFLSRLFLWKERLSGHVGQDLVPSVTMLTPATLLIPLTSNTALMAIKWKTKLSSVLETKERMLGLL